MQTCVIVKLHNVDVSYLNSLHSLCELTIIFALSISLNKYDYDEKAIRKYSMTNYDKIIIRLEIIFLYACKYNRTEQDRTEKKI